MKKVFTLATAAVLAGVIFAPVSQGSPSRSCGQSGWAATAQGAPKLAAAGYYVWHDGRGWHLRAKGDGRASLTGRVSADARVGVIRTAGVRKALKVKARSVSFSLGAARATEAIDMKAACASRLSFTFGGKGSASLPVFLGAQGQAPAASFGLTRSAATGVSGQIVVAGTCPGAVGPGTTCPPPQPTQGTVRIETAAPSKGGPGAGQLVKTVESDAQGNFSTDLAPGLYQLVVDKQPAGYPVPKPVVVEVQAGVVTNVVLILDSGAR